MHLRDREKALSEMVRVTKPGGRIVVREPDWDTLIVDSPDKDLTRSILDRHFDRVILNGWAGRELFRQFRLAGRNSVEIADTSTLVLTDFATANGFYGLEAAAKAMGEAADGWIAGLKRADRDRDLLQRRHRLHRRWSETMTETPTKGRTPPRSL